MVSAPRTVPLPCSRPVLAYNPQGVPEPTLAAAVSAAGGLGVLDLAALAAPEAAVAKLAAAGHPFGVRFEAPPAFALPANAKVVILAHKDPRAHKADLARYAQEGRTVLVEAWSAEGAKHAEEAGAHGVIAKGNEAGGRVARETTLVLLQRLLLETRLPVLAQGGLGPRGAAAALAAGAGAVVLDVQLYAAAESPLAPHVKQFLASLDGTDTAVVGASTDARWRFFARALNKKVNGLLDEERRALVAGTPEPERRAALAAKLKELAAPGFAIDYPIDAVLPVGQDVAFTGRLAARHKTAAAILTAYAQAVEEGLAAASGEQPLASGSAAARALGVTNPVATYPNARLQIPAAMLGNANPLVTAGGFPVLPLGASNAEQTEAIVQAAKQAFGAKPFGVTVRGDGDPMAREAQLQVLKRLKAAAVVLVNGTPEAALDLESAGVRALLVVHSSRALHEALSRGVTRFILEGIETGNAPGPFASLVLWEEAAEALAAHLQANPAAPDVTLLPSGGIATAEGAAAVAALFAPLAPRVAVAVALDAIPPFSNDPSAEGAPEETLLVGDTVKARIRLARSPAAEAVLVAEARRYLDGMPQSERKAALEADVKAPGVAPASDTYLVRRPGSTVASLIADLTTGATARVKATAEALRIAPRAPKARAPAPTPAAKPSAPAAAAPRPTLTSPTPANWPFETEPVHHSVAIVGVGGIFPKALTAKQFWQNVLDKTNGIIDVPKERWDPALYYDADPAAVDKTYTKIGGFVEGFKFNPLQFKIPPNVARSLDQVQQWVLTATAEALADAGYDQKPFDRSRCAVILGNAMGGVEIKDETTRRVYFAEAAQAFAHTAEFKTLPAEAQKRILGQAESQFKAKLAPITEDSMPGELSNVIAGRVANVFNLGGKNVTTDAACAASHAAFDTAVKGLVSGEFDMVVCGGADRSMDPATYVKFCKIGALSPTGSTPFDARANGFVMGEGAGILVLKRLTDAVRDGDKVYAVLRGIGSSSDGKGKGITAPNPEGQKLAVKRALEHAALKPRYVQLVEAHGTSTKVGDVVEVESLASLFGADAKPGTVALGSVKSQIGHLKSAAGAAGVLKAALALHHKTLPPSANFETPNPNITWSDVPFYVNTQPKPWPAPAHGEPRRAAVSAFGFGGTNFHIILEEYVPQYHARLLEAPTAAPAPAFHAVAPAPAPVPAARMPELEADVLAFSADTPEGLAASVMEAIGAAKADPVPLPRFAAARRKSKGKVRLAVSASSTEQVPAQLTSVLELLADPKKRAGLPMKGAFAAEGPREGKVAFLFPGQGSQYANMLRDAYRKYRVVEETFHEADRVLEPLIGKKLTALIFVDPKDGEAVKRAEEALKQTEVTQPAMLAADVALLRLLRQWGLEPDAVAGHSLGEYAALVAAGVLTFEDALLAVSARGKEMAAVKVPDFGKMASITADTATVEAILKDIDGYVVAANKNCPSQTVIAGASDAVVKAMAACQAKGLQVVPLNVSAAFHTAIVAPASEPLGRVVARLNIQSPKVPVIANVNAEPYPTERQAIVEMLAKQVAAPVEWQKSLERLYADGVRIFIEVGPKRALAGFVENTFPGKPVHALMLNHPKKGDLPSLNEASARLLALGVDLNLPAPTDASAYTPTFLASIAPPAPAPAPVPQAAPMQAPVPTPVSAAQGPAPAVAHATFFPSLEKDPAFRDYLQMYGGAVEQFLHASFDVYKRELAPLREKAARFERFGFCTDDIVIAGAAVGLPGRAHKVFGDVNFERLFRGENGIDRLTEQDEREFLDRHIVRLVKDGGEPRFEVINDIAQVLKLAARKGEFDLAKEFGIDGKLASTLDTTFKLAIAAGIDALRDAGIPLVREEVVTTTGRTLPGPWVLPKELQNETGVIFASAFPGVDNWVGELNRYFAHKYGHSAFQELMDLYGELVREIKDPTARAKITGWFTEHAQRLKDLQGPEDLYEFNRKFLFSVLSLGHAEFAELFNVRGPNTQVNAACASTTQAIAMAEDWIRTGRARRVIVIGADDVTSDNLLPWIGSGFLASGAATTAATVAEGALPFDRRRHGMIIGMGAVGIVVEAAPEAEKRGITPVARLIATHMVNSAYHGSRLDVAHIVGEVEKLVARVEDRLGKHRGQFARDTLFVSHETYTPARGGSAAAEVHALRKAFGDRFLEVLVANTKGFTGHPMGAGIEDALAVKCLQYGKVPPIANFREPDPDLGPMNLSKGGTHERRYTMRLAAGFGSQLALFFAEKMAHGDQRIADPARHQAWLDRMAGRAGAKLEVVNRTLRIVEGPRAPAASAPVPAPMPAPAPAAPAPAPAPKPAAPVPVPVTVAPAASPATTVDREAVRARVVKLVSEKTGYPEDMLALDLDMEADLGVDTVKQAEVFGALREAYQLPQEEGLKLKDYPTLNHVIDYFAKRAGGTPAASAAPGPVAAALAPAQPAPMPVPVTVTPAPAPAPAVSAPAAPTGSADREDIKRRLLKLVSEKTGYPEDMLALDLDMEADLGIDTVKQAEVFGALRDAYSLPRDDSLKLKDYPTLNHVIGYIASRLEGVAPAAPVPVVEPAPAAAVAVPVPVAAPTAAPVSGPAPAPTPVASGNLDPAEVLGTIKRIVSEKTGYPDDLLDPDLDMEADLGIDTVKQAEVFSLVREKYGIARVENLQLKDYPTLGRVVQFVIQHAGAPPAAAPETASAPAAAAPTTQAPPAEPIGHPRLVPRLIPLPAVEPPASLQGKGVLVTEDGPVAADLARRLSGLGATVHLARPPATKEEAESIIQEARTRLGRVDVLLHVSPLSLLPVAPADADAEAWNGAANLHVKGFFRLGKLLNDDLSREGARTIAVTALGGYHGLREARGSPLAGGVTGLAKGLAKEWARARVTALDLQAGETAEKKAEAILRELNAPAGPVEVGIHGPERVGVVLGRLPAVPRAATQDTLRGAHLVVSGGAQGITAEILKGIAPGRGLRLTLLGRTALVPNAKQLAAMDEAGLKLLREKTAEALKAKGERVTPVKLEQTLAPLLKAREVQLTLDSLTAAGAEVHYVACDVTDPQGVSMAVHEGRGRFGPVTGVIHAAGLEESKLLPDKTHEAFDRIFDTKVKGLHALARATRDDPVFLQVSFGSVAGRFGNAGQVDYSAANDLLAKAAHLASAKGADGRLIAWTAWAGVGMATKGSIMQVLAAAGVEPLTVQEGVTRFLDEIATPGEPEVVAAKALGALAQPPTVEVAPLLAKRPLLQTLVQHDAGNRVVARTRLDPATDTWLQDHAVDGVPYLPGVDGLEAFVEAASLLAHGTVVEARNIHWDYPVKFLKGGVDFTVEARVVSSTPTEALVQCVLQTVPPGPPGATPQPRTHFRATLVVAAARRILGTGTLPQLNAVSVNKAAIYQRYFHGPTFRVLNAATGLQGNAIRVLGDNPATGAPVGMASPMAIEGALQAAGLWGLAVPGVMSLPHAVQRVEWDGQSSPGELVYQATQREAKQGVTVYDVEAFDTQGLRRLRLQGLELITTGPIPEDKRLPLTPFPAEGVQVGEKQA